MTDIAEERMRRHIAALRSDQDVHRYLATVFREDLRAIVAIDVGRLAAALDNVDREYEQGWTPAHYARAIANEYARIEPAA